MRFFLRTMLCSFVLLQLCGSLAIAQDVEAQKSRKALLEREIAILDRQLKDNAAQSTSALSKLTLVQTKIKARQSVINQSDKEIAALTGQINAKQRDIILLGNQLDTMTIYYERLVKNAYKNRDAKLWYMYILASDNLSQGLRRYGYLKNLSRELNAQAVKIKSSRDSLEVEKGRLELLRKDAEKLRNQRVTEMKSLQSDEAEQKKLTDRLKKEMSKNQKELASKRAQAQALEKEIKRAINNALNGKSSGSSKTAEAIDYKLAGEFAANKGKLPWPVEGSVISRFGKQYHPVFKSLQMPQNNGITLAVMQDAPVKAVYEGTVKLISVLPGYHQCILIQHGNYFTLYCKMKTVSVKSGEKVKTSQQIGTVDTINGETAFHFEVWNEKTVPQNPEGWLRPR